VLLTFTLPSDSPALEFLNSTLFNNLQYGTTITTGVTQETKTRMLSPLLMSLCSHAFTAKDLKVDELVADAEALADAVEDAAADIAADLELLGASGVASSALAVGTYNYDDLDIVDASFGPGITNKWCNDFMSTVSTSAAQADLKAALAVSMSAVLPLSVGGIEFSDEDIECKPFDPKQTARDQPAYFHINDLKISALFSLFANGASYVDFSGVANYDPLIMKPEATAELSVAQVLYGLRLALRTEFLRNLAAKIGMFSVAMSSMFADPMQSRTRRILTRRLLRPRAGRLLDCRCLLLLPLLEARFCSLSSSSSS
jgi:hypothetical protein